jgi:hypothetical protein
LSALQPWNTSKASKSALRGREKAPIRFILHRTPSDDGHRDGDAFNLGLDAGRQGQSG